MRISNSSYGYSTPVVDMAMRFGRGKTPAGSGTQRTWINKGQRDFIRHAAARSKKLDLEHYINSSLSVRPTIFAAR
jgi:hypothetical protein